MFATIAIIGVVIRSIILIRRRRIKNRLINYESRLVESREYKKSPTKSIKFPEYNVTAMSNGEIHIWNDPHYPYAIIKSDKTPVKALIFNKPYLYIQQDQLYVWKFDFDLKFIGCVNTEEIDVENKLNSNYYYDKNSRSSFDIRADQEGMYIYDRMHNGFHIITDDVSTSSPFFETVKV